MSVFETQALLASARVRREDIDRAVSSGLLQPRHYLEVVEERVTAGRCGYPLCPQSLAREPPSRLILDPVSGEFVSRRETEFCSRECGRQSAALLRLIEGSAHFGSADTSASSVDDLLRAMGVEVDEETVTQEDPLSPPKFSSSRLTPTGEVMAPEDQPTEGDGRPKRLRQLRKKVPEASSAESSSGPVMGSSDPEVQPSDNHRDPGVTSFGLHASSANVTFASLNYSSLILPLSQKAPSNDIASVVKARAHAAPLKRGAKVVTWSDEVKDSAPITGSGPAPRTQTQSPMPPLVGAVIERSHKTTVLPVLPTSPQGGGIEGYETRVERLPSPEGKGGSPPAEDAAASALASDSDTDSDSPSLDDFDFPLDSEDHFASLNLFAVLWLVSDDLFGGLLPLSMSLAPMDAVDSEDSPESRPPSLFPELNRGERCNR